MIPARNLELCAYAMTHNIISCIATNERVYITSYVSFYGKSCTLTESLTISLKNIRILLGY